MIVQVFSRFNPKTGLVEMAVGRLLVLATPGVFRNILQNICETSAEADDWELKHGNGELDGDSALTAFERMLTNGW